MDTEETFNPAYRRKDENTSLGTITSQVVDAAQTYRNNVPTHEKLIDVPSTERHAYNYSLTPSITKSVRKTF